MNQPVSDSVAALLGSPLFREAAPSEVEATAGLWHARRLAAGDVLWHDKTPADALAVVHAGALEVLVQGQPIARVGAGSMIGESSTFLVGETRTATVRAAAPTEIVVLRQEALITLRAEHPGIYDLLLARALLSLARSLDQNSATIARLARGDAEDPRDEAGSLLRAVWKRLTGRAPTSAPSLRPALRQLPVLRHASDEILSSIIAAMTPEHVEEGHALVLEGDAGDALYVIAEGEIEVARAARQGGTVRLALLGAGDLFGTGGFLLGTKRSASCVAVRPSWAFRMDRPSFDRLGGEPGRVFREGLLCALREQLLDSGARLARLEAGAADGAASGESLPEALLRAAGSAVAWKGVEGSWVKLATHR